MAALTQPSTKPLRRRGVGGEVTVALADGALLFTGSKGGQLRVAPGDVQRLRVGREQGRYTLEYRARLWVDGDSDPIVLYGHHTDASVYVPMMRAFGAAVAAAGRLDRLEKGTTTSNATLLFVLMGLLTVAALGVSIFALAREPWPLRFLPVLAPAALAAGGYAMMRRDLPQPVASLEEFNAAVE